MTSSKILSSEGLNSKSWIGALAAAIFCYIFVYNPSIEFFSIDDLNSLSPYGASGNYAGNLIPKGRYAAYLIYEFFKFFGINIHAAYSASLMVTLVAIAGCVHLFSKFVQLDSFLASFCITAFIALSPQNYELMHFRHGILIDLGTYAGTALLLYSKLKSKPIYWYILAGIVMLSGYTSSLPLLLCLLGIFTIFELKDDLKSILRPVLFYSIVLIVSIIAHMMITKLLCEIYDVSASQGVSLNIEQIKKNWAMISRSGKWMMNENPYTNLPFIYHAILYVIVSITLLIKIEKWWAKTFALFVLLLMYWVAFFNIYLLFVKLTYLPGRAYLHVQIFTGFMILITAAYLQDRERLSKIWMSVPVILALMFTFTMMGANVGIKTLRQQDEVIATALISKVTSYEKPPKVLVVYDNRSLRHKKRHRLVFGDIKTLLLVPWSQYSYLQYMGLGDSLVKETDKDKIEIFETKCRERSNDNFAYDITAGVDYVYLCL